MKYLSVKSVLVGVFFGLIFHTLFTDPILLVKFTASSVIGAAIANIIFIIANNKSHESK